MSKDLSLPDLVEVNVLNPGEPPKSVALASNDDDPKKTKVWLWETCVRDGVLVDPQTFEKREELCVLIEKSELRDRLKTATKIRAYSQKSERKERNMVLVSVKGVYYRLGLLSHGKKAKHEHSFVLSRENAETSVFSLQLSYEDRKMPTKKSRGVRRLRKREREEEYEALSRSRSTDEENFGDDAYAYQQLEEDESIWVADVVAIVGGGFVTRQPKKEDDIVKWGIVANHHSSRGFSKALPQPFHLGRGQSITGKCVYVVTRGICCVRLEGDVRNGELVVVSGSSVGCAKRLLNGDYCSDSKLILGRVLNCIKGGHFALVKVNLESSILMAPKPLLLKGDEKLRLALDDAESLLAKDDMKGAKASHLFLLLSEISLGEKKWKRAKKYAKKSFKLSGNQSDAALIVHARCFLKKKKPLKAVEVLKKTVNSDRGDVLHWRKQASWMLFEQMQKPHIDSVRQELETILSSAEDVGQATKVDGDPVYASHHMQMCDYLKERNFDEADEYLKILPNHLGIFVAYGEHMLLIEKDYEKAEKLLRSAMKLSVEGQEGLVKRHAAVARGLLAVLHFCMDDSKKVQDFALVKDFSSVDDICLLALGNLCLDRNFEVVALDFFRMAVERGAYERVGNALGFVEMMIAEGNGMVENEARGLRYLRRALELGAKYEYVELVRDIESGKFRKDREALLKTVSESDTELSRAICDLRELGGPFEQNFDRSVLKEASSGFAKSVADTLRLRDQAMESLNAGGCDEDIVSLLARAFRKIFSSGCLTFDDDGATLLEDLCERVLQKDQNSIDALVVRSCLCCDVDAMKRAKRICEDKDPFVLALLASARGPDSRNLKYYIDLGRQAMKLAPSDVEVLHLIQRQFRHLQMPDLDEETKEVTQKFLEVCPLDHPRRPAMLYYLACIDKQNRTEWFKKGELAEKDQLDAFLPHLSEEKQLCYCMLGIPLNISVDKDKYWDEHFCPRRKQTILDFESGDLGSIVESTNDGIDPRPFPDPMSQVLVLADFVPWTSHVHMGCDFPENFESH